MLPNPAFLFYHIQLRLRQDGNVDPISNIFGWVRTQWDKTLKALVPRPHQGVDLFAPVGTPIYAVAQGQIVAAKVGYNGDWGNYIILRFTTEEGQVKYAFYAHLSEIKVTAGEVKPGTAIGKTGRTGTQREFQRMNLISILKSGTNCTLEGN